MDEVLGLGVHRFDMVNDNELLQPCNKCFQMTPLMLLKPYILLPPSPLPQHKAPMRAQLRAVSNTPVDQKPT